MIESTSDIALSAVGGDQLLSELGRMLKENAEYKQRNEALEQEVRKLKMKQSLETIPSSSEENGVVATLQNQILALQGKNQASEQILASTKAENEKLLETIVQLSAESMILREQQQQLNEGIVSGQSISPSDNIQHGAETEQSSSNHHPSSTTDNDDNASHPDDTGLQNATTATTSATIEELQDTIEHLQQRLMYQVEEKLILQTKVETLEHLLVEEKGAFRSILESQRGHPKSPSPQILPPQQAPSRSKPQQPPSRSKPPPKQTPRQADIIREALERKKSKNLRTRMNTKIYNHTDAKIDVGAYQQLYEEQLKQERLDQRIRKPNSERSNSPAGSLSSSFVQTPTAIQSDPNLSPNKQETTTPLNKIGTEHLTTRLWDFDDWEVQNNPNETGGVTKK